VRPVEEASMSIAKAGDATYFTLVPMMSRRTCMSSRWIRLV
jgi:hypothetical protein